MAILGGLVLGLLIIIVCLSIVGRTGNTLLHSELMQGTAPQLAESLLALGIGSINGDFELVESGIAFTVFAFLPLCQITSGHASVGIFTDKLPARIQQILRMLIELLFAIVLVLIARQLEAGMESKIRSGQTTFLLQFPVWWAYAACLAGAVVAAVVGVYMALIRVIEACTGRVIIADDAGAEH